MLFHYFTALSYSLSAYALVRDLTVGNALIAPDGFSRDASVAEGAFPMPIITGNKGDNFQINVINVLNDSSMAKSTSMHWHGIFQEHTNWADGPAFVNQCPIATNHSFLYNFTVPDQAGTFWYHSHLGVQYCDGLRGPMIIYDPDDPLKDMYDVDDETTVITLSDWYHLATPVLPRPAVADSVLINGLGRYAGGPASPISITNVEQGKRYRMRLISMSCEPNYIFSIDGHNMTIIEADGIETQPLLVDSIQIYSAQRYSFILTANQPINNYWMRVIPDIGPLGFDGGINSAILRYAGASDADPSSIQSPSVMPLFEPNLHVLNPVPVPGGPSPGDVDVAYNLLLNFTGTGFTINDTPFQGPNVPILLQILSGAQIAQDLMPSGSIYPLPRNKSIEISIPGGVIGGPHPFHLHGAAFHVVRSAESTTYNYDNPVMRDTVSIGSDVSDNMTFRFQTTNSGPWFLHCHIEFHLEMGLGIVFTEDQPDVVVDNPVPDAWTDLCPIYNTLDEFQLGFVGR